MSVLCSQLISAAPKWPNKKTSCVFKRLNSKLTVQA